MRLPGPRAGDKGIQPLDLVREPLGEQEVQGAVGYGRLRATPLFGQALQDIVGSERPVPLQQELQYAAARRREL